MSFYSEISNDPVMRSRFHTFHTIAPLGDKHYQVTMTGVILIDRHGASQDWKKERVEIQLELPKYFLPKGKVFELKSAAPFITINAIYNQEHAVNAGWSVDDFGFKVPNGKKMDDCAEIWADIAIRDADSCIYSIGYTLTLVGFEADL